MPSPAAAVDTEAAGPTAQDEMIESTPGLLLIERDPATGAWRAIAEAERGDGWEKRILAATPMDGEG